jgi:hypothetical protein
MHPRKSKINRYCCSLSLRQLNYNEKIAPEELCSLLAVELRRQVMYLCCIEDNVDIYWEAEVLSSAASFTPTLHKDQWMGGWVVLCADLGLWKDKSFVIITTMELRFLGRSLVNISTELSLLTTKG